MPPVAHAFQNKTVYLQGVTVTATASASGACGFDFVIRVTDGDQHFVSIDYTYQTASDPRRYAARAHDLGALGRMVDLQAALAERGIADSAAIAVFVAGEGAKSHTDPYTGQAFRFDPQTRQLSFKPRAAQHGAGNSRSITRAPRWSYERARPADDAWHAAFAAFRSTQRIGNSFAPVSRNARG